MTWRHVETDSCRVSVRLHTATPFIFSCFIAEILTCPVVLWIPNVTTGRWLQLLMSFIAILDPSPPSPSLHHHHLYFYCSANKLSTLTGRLNKQYPKTLFDHHALFVRFLPLCWPINACKTARVDLILRSHRVY